MWAGFNKEGFSQLNMAEHAVQSFGDRQGYINDDWKLLITNSARVLLGIKKASLAKKIDMTYEREEEMRFLELPPTMPGS